jgi:endonuclease-3 related protein
MNIMNGIGLPKFLFDVLFNAFGPQQWWPIDTTYHQSRKSDPGFEIIIGAILTQNTAWTNVEKAIRNLKKHNALSIQRINDLEEGSLKTFIQTSGFFNQKAQRLKLFSSYLLKNYQGDLNIFFSRNTAEIRQELLSLPGIGPETADSILLYAGNHPVFVIDAYTKRICKRYPCTVNTDSYEDLRCFFEESLTATLPKHTLVSTYKELHALIVKLAKDFCRKTHPNCPACPLTGSCQKLF